LPCSEDEGLTRHTISSVENTIVDMILEQDIILSLQAIRRKPSINFSDINDVTLGRSAVLGTRGLRKRQKI
jgi:hypothetical protein